MRYPNTRYGSPAEFLYYVQNVPLKIIAKELKRSEKSVKCWISGERKIPWWVPELLRLKHKEHCEQMREMGFKNFRVQLGEVKGQIIDFSTHQKGHTLRSGPDRGAVAIQTTPSALLHHVCTPSSPNSDATMKAV